MLVTLTGAGLGLLLGVRHALEPDHLTAVSTLMTEGRGARRGAVLGAFWGLGHTLSLFAVGVALAGLQAELPSPLADAFELAVAVMLVVLGARNLRRAVHGAGLHAHGGRLHVHAGGSVLARRSLVVGLVHGLAGSGALTALVVSRLPTAGARLLYILLFGLGSAAGMALVSAIAGWPLERLRTSARADRGLAALTGGLSSLLGIAWAWPLVARLVP